MSKGAQKDAGEFAANMPLVRAAHQERRPVMFRFEEEGQYVDSVQEIKQRIESTKNLHQQIYTSGFTAGVKAGMVIGLLFGIPFGALCLACYLAGWP